MKQVEVVYSNSMKINRGNYEQEAPFYSSKSILTLDDKITPKQAKSVIEDEYDGLKAIVEPLLKADYDAKRTDLQNVRIREKNGKKYPSVTSIMNPDGLSSKIKNLDAYAERGNQADLILKHYIKTGKICDAKPEKFSPLEWEFDIPEFIKANELEKLVKNDDVKADVEFFDEDYMFSGEIDVLMGGSVIDIKTGSYSPVQLAAYSHGIKTKDPFFVWDLKKGKIVNWSEEKSQKAWEQFLVKRGEFKARFGI